MKAVVLVSGVACLFWASVAAGEPGGGGQAVVGWRTDGTGCYPQADPPLEWDTKKNVVWATPTATWGNATPVLVGDRIFIGAEQTELICLSKADGKVLWKKSNPLADAMTEQDKAQAAGDKLKADELRNQARQAKQEATKVRGEANQAQEAAAAPDASADAKQRVQDLRKQAADLEQKAKDLEDQSLPYRKWEMPGAESNNGHSSPTPVSDGKFVYVLYGNGLAACYDLEGDRKWTCHVERPPHGWGHSTSPLLADGGKKLIVHYATLMALDTASGKVVWKADGPKQHWGTPAIARIGAVELIVTPGGDVVRASDGKVLASNLANLAYGSPLVVGDVAYFTDGAGASAIKLAAKSPDQIEAKKLWQAAVPKDRYYTSPLLCDKVLYGMTQKGIVTAIDAETGSILYSKDLELGAGTCYPSLSLAGKLLLASIDSGITVVIAPGREFKQIARNTLEKFRASPVCEGKRMYIRAYKNMYCLGQ